jgi:hypothetical protein
VIRVKYQVSSIARDGLGTSHLNSQFVSSISVQLLINYFRIHFLQFVSTHTKPPTGSMPSGGHPQSSWGLAARRLNLDSYLLIISSKSTFQHRSMAWIGHGLSKVSLELAIPYPSKPCRRPPLKQPYGPFWHFQGWPSALRAAFGRLPPPWIPRAVRLCLPSFA